MRRYLALFLPYLPTERWLFLQAGGAPPDDRPYVTLANPISPERTSMRHSLLTSVLEVMSAPYVRTAILKGLPRRKRLPRAARSFHASIDF